MSFRLKFVGFLIILLSCIIACGPDRNSNLSEIETRYVYGQEVPKDKIKPPKIYSNITPKTVELKAPKVHRKNSSKSTFPNVPKISVKSAEEIRISPHDYNYPEAKPITSVAMKAGVQPRITASATWQENEGKSIFYTARDGLPTMGMTALRQDSDGAIWGSSRYEGMWKFDGYSFTYFNDNNGLIDNAVIDFWIDQDDDIWIGGSTGLSMNDGQSILHLTGNNEVSRLKPTKFAEDNDGNMWVGSIEGLYKIDKRKKTITHFTSDQGLMDDNVNALLFDQKGRLWIAHNQKGFSRMSFSKNKDQTEFEVQKFIFSQDAPVHFVQCMIEHTNGDIFIGADQELIIIDKSHLVSEEELVYKRYENGIFDMGFIYAIVQDVSGQMWIANDNSIALVNDDYQGLNYTIEYLDTEVTPMAGPTYYTIFEDTEENIWVGHGQRKLTKIPPRSSLDGFLEGFDVPFSVRSFQNDRYGNIWFQSHNDGLYCRTTDQQTGEEILLFYDITSYSVNLVKDGEGNIWFGYQQLLYKIEPTANGIMESVSVFGDDPSWPIKNINDLHIGSKGELWIASNTIANYDKIVKYGGGGAYKFNGKRIYEYREEQGLVFGETSAIFVDTFDRVWFKSMERGLTEYVPADENAAAQWIHFPADDLENGSLFRSLYFTNNIFGRDQNIPLAIKLDPAHPSRMEINLIPTLPIINGQERIMFHKISKDKYWVSSNFGLEIIEEHLMNGKSEIYRQSFLTRNGYPLNLGANLVLFEDQTVWCPTPDNIYSMDVAEITKKATPRAITSFDAYLKSEKRTSQQLTDLRYDENYLRFEFNVTAVNQPENVFYRYQLEGFDPLISEPMTSTEVSYTKIPHGNFTFKVQARNRNSDWGPFYAQAIRISPPWYKTWWFYLSCAILFASAIYLVFRSRLNHLIAMERLRTKISSDLHDDLGSMLSGLAMQSELLETNAKKENIPRIKKITETSRGAVHRMRDLVWSIDSRRDKMSDLFEKMEETAEDLLIPAGFKYNFDIHNTSKQHKKMAIQVRQNLLLIYKEALTNIVKHSNGDCVYVLITNDNNHLYMAIKDNGLLNGDAFENSKKTIGTGQGLMNMEIRAKHLQGTLDINKKEGFEIRVKIPHNHIYM